MLNITPTADKPFGLRDETIVKIHRVFANFPTIEQALIYGSRAKGNYSTGSDIDITLIGKNIDYKMIGDIDFALDDLLLPYRFDLSAKHLITDESVLKHIQRVGKVFYQKTL